MQSIDGNVDALINERSRKVRQRLQYKEVEWEERFEESSHYAPRAAPAAGAPAPAAAAVQHYHQRQLQQLQIHFAKVTAIPATALVYIQFCSC